jgi:polyhydroxybutyrate depolymerase
MSKIKKLVQKTLGIMSDDCRLYLLRFTYLSIFKVIMFYKSKVRTILFSQAKTIMKIIYLSVTLLLLPILSFSQQTITANLMHDGIEREYILYIPANYTGDEAVPLVFNFHGFTSNANQQLFYGDFRTIADTEGFIIAHPEGTLLNGSTHWNVGGFTLGSTVDDVGFTEAMIDAIADSYNINLDRVYATGMSNGGYMSFLLACQLSDKIAAVASVTGSMTPETYDACDAQHPTPILQMHGTIDAVVPYNGSTWTKSIDDVMEYWIEYNNCDPTPEIEALPNLDVLDGSTVEHIIYTNNDNGVTAEHYKITGGGHTWPGFIFGTPGTGTNQDIDASLEIWNFFNRYDINGLITTTNSEDISMLKPSAIQVYPNPATSSILVERGSSRQVVYELYSSSGVLQQQGILKDAKQTIDISTLPADVYLLRVDDQLKKVIKMQ